MIYDLSKRNRSKRKQETVALYVKNIHSLFRNPNECAWNTVESIWIKINRETDQWWPWQQLPAQSKEKIWMIPSKSKLSIFQWQKKLKWWEALIVNIYWEANFRNHTRSENSWPALLTSFSFRIWLKVTECRVG